MVSAVVLPLWTWVISQSLDLFALGKKVNDGVRYPWSIPLCFQEMFKFLFHEFSLRTGQNSLLWFDFWVPWLLFPASLLEALFWAQRFKDLFNTFEFCFVCSIWKAVMRFPRKETQLQQNHSCQFLGFKGKKQGRPCISAKAEGCEEMFSVLDSSSGLRCVYYSLPLQKQILVSLLP